MHVLGLHFGHDSSLALIKDGELLSCIELERTKRKRHAIGIRAADINELLERHSLAPSDIDFCAITSTQGIEYLVPDKGELNLSLVDDESETEQHFRLNKICETRSSHPYIKALDSELYKAAKHKDCLGSIEAFINPDPWKEHFGLKDLSRYLLNDPGAKEVRKGMSKSVEVTLFGNRIPGRLYSHHYAHAAYAYYSSPFDNCVIVTQDGSLPRDGYWCGMIYRGCGNIVYPLAPHYCSIGKLYENVGAFLGLERQSGPGKLMGLAPYGTPVFFNEKYICNLTEAYTINQDYDERVLDFTSIDDPLSGKWLSHCLLTAESLDYKIDIGNSDEILSQFSKDLAASTQKLLEETICSLVSSATDLANSVDKASSANLCFSGGTALNCPANQEVYKRRLSNKLFIPPAVHDGGLSIGAAFSLYYDHLGNERSHQAIVEDAGLALKGYPIEDQELRLSLETYKHMIRVEKSDDWHMVAAEAIDSNQIIALVFGRSEIGPRALGHRSIIANATIVDNWKSVNLIKKREHWRPFAPAVLKEDLYLYFKNIPDNSPYMLMTADVIDSRLPAVTHVDGSARVQTVDESSRELHLLLKSYKELSGISVVMNTSYNGPGEPIIQRAHEALEFFVNSEIDILFMEGYIIKRKGLS